MEKMSLVADRDAKVVRVQIVYCVPRALNENGYDIWQ